MARAAISVLCSVRVTLTNHYWVTSDERRRNVAEVGLDLVVHAVAVRVNGGLRRRALSGKLLLQVSTDLPTVALFHAAAGSVPRDSHAPLPSRLVRWW